MPTLTVSASQSAVHEGELAVFHVDLSAPLSQPFQFRASTLSVGNASSANGDYDGFADTWFTFPAGSTRYYVVVQTNEIYDPSDGHETFGLLVDAVSDPSVTIGTGQDYQTILETVQTVELEVLNSSGDEGDSISFEVRAAEPVPFDTLVYLEVQTGSTTAAIANGNWWVSGVIPQGQTSVNIDIDTVDDGQSGTKQIGVKLIPDRPDVQVIDDTAYANVYDTTQPSLPTLSVWGDVTPREEGGELWFTVELSEAISQGTWVWVTPENITTQSNDYSEITGSQVFIPAGQTQVQVKFALTDDGITEGTESFGVRATYYQDPGYDGTQHYVIVDDFGSGEIIDPTGQPPQGGQDLSAFQHIIDTLVVNEGVTGAAQIISESQALYTGAGLLEANGTLEPGLWQELGGGSIGGDPSHFLSLGWWPSVLAFVAKEAYKVATGDDLFNEISYGELIDSPGATAPSAMNFTSEQVAANGYDNLEAGNYVDGRLVVHQPWVAFDDSGALVSTVGKQGRYTSEDPSMTVSHAGNFANSMDYSPTSEKMFAVAVASGTIVDVKLQYSSASGVYGVANAGNIVTIELDQVTVSGDPIYLTYAHLAQDLAPKIQIGEHVEAGAILGEVGDTGGYNLSGVFQHYEKHGHITVGTDTRIGTGSAGETGEIADGDIDTVPPIYMLGLNSENVALAGEAGLPIGFEQDIGFPMGDTASGEANILKSVSPTLTFSEILDANTGKYAASDLGVTNGGQGGGNSIPDPIWYGTAAAEDNSFWQGKVSGVNEFVYAGDGYDFILGSGGDDVIDAEGDGGQMNLIGAGAIRANFVFTQLADGGVEALSLDGSFGTDRYYNVDGVWFNGYGDIPGDWYNLADLLINTESDGDGAAPTETWQTFDEQFAGTAGDDLIRGGSGIDWFTATAGDDFIFGGDGQSDDPDWNQVNFLGVQFSEMEWGYDAASDLLYSSHASLGRDVYDADVTDYWFENGGWHGRAELISLADDNFVFV